MALIEFLQKRIAQLQTELPATEQAIAQLQERMQEADRRRSSETETEKYHKWNQVFLRLEHDLDKARAKLAQCQAELKERRDRLQEAQSQAAREEQELTQAEAERDKVKSEFMSMSVEELANLSLEDIARLQAAEQGQESVPVAEAQSAKAKTDVPIEPVEEERTRKQKTRMALEKVIRQQVDSVGWEELDLLLACYAERVHSGNSKDEIMTRLEAFLRNTAQRCAAYCAAWQKVSSG